MKRVRNYFIIFVLVVWNNAQAETESSPCTKKDFDYAKSWGNSYKPEEAYKFGIKIQKLVREKDLQQLFELIDGELSNGPRRKYVNGKNMSDVFSDGWQEMVLAEKPSCSPVGWRGFMLGRGMIWYKNTERGWHIFSMNGASEEKFNTSGLPVTWDIDAQSLSHQCFVTLWMSSDNFEEYEEKFHIKNVEDFRRNIGRYLGKEIPTLKPIVPSWSDKGQTISLVGYPKQCAVDKSKLTINNRSVENKICDDNSLCTEYEYEVLDGVSKERCSEMAPHIPGHCQNAYLVKIGDYSGGTIGWQFQFNIYGLFTLSDNSKIVAPLVIFHNENEARNYLDKLNK